MLNNHNRFRNFKNANAFYRGTFKLDSIRVAGATWQGKDISDKPDMVTHELPFQSFVIDLRGVMSSVRLGDMIVELQEDIRPNLPWAEDHFAERVCGWPINPGIEWRNWPWNSSAEGFRKDEKFNHNYMERLWPRYAGMVETPSKTIAEFKVGLDALSSNEISENFGIYRSLGDLRSLVEQLAFDPLTRQAVIPLYFPEDTGAPDRKPCTLLYQFMVRGNRLHMFYPLRSCDFFRHWRDDCYMAVRLQLWVLEECKRLNPAYWNTIEIGEYHMHMTSFHVFANDLRSL